MRGQIIKIVSDTHWVFAEKKEYACKCRGIFRHNQIVPLVGDYVEFSEKDHIIEKIEPRKNSFLRPAVSNIDQAFLVTSLKEPDFSTYLLDKLLIWMELHQTESIICLTKKDLLTEQEIEKLSPILKYYEQLGYTVLYNTDILKIKKLLNGKTSVFTGQTGAGKSTLLNKIHPDWDLKVGEISKALGRGKHTTRVTELFLLEEAKVLDTPGFSALDLKEYSPEEIKSAFREFNQYACPYADCTHTNEKECVIKQKVLEKKILKSRYQSYLKFIERR